MIGMVKSTRTKRDREDILAEGFKLLSRQGYNGTGLKQILDSVQIPKGSFYHYFKSKEYFVAEVIENYIDRLLTHFDQHLEKSDENPIQSIKTLYQLLIDEFQRTQCTQGCLIGGLTAELGGQSKPLQRAMQHGYSQWADRFQALVTVAQNQNLIRSDLSAEEITEMFWCTWEGAILRMKMTGSTDALNRILLITLETLLKPQDRES